MTGGRGLKGETLRHDCQVNPLLLLLRSKLGRVEETNAETLLSDSLSFKTCCTLSVLEWRTNMETLLSNSFSFSTWLHLCHVTIEEWFSLMKMFGHESLSTAETNILQANVDLDWTRLIVLTQYS